MSDEQYGFVFAVTFIVIFSVLLSTIPADFQGQAETPDMLIPLDPSIITGFSDTADYNKSNFNDMGLYLQYTYYDLADRDWIVTYYTGIGFYLGAKILYGGFLYLGTLDSVKFTSTEGIDRENSLSLAEIEEDADDGVIRYNLQYYANGASAGGFVVYWNTTLYATSTIAWDAGGLFIVHGVGFAETARGDAGALLIQLLFLQLPDVPLLVNILLITPLWACIIFVLWFIIKEMIPFV